MIDLEILKGNFIIGLSAIFGLFTFNISSALADPDFVSLIQSYVSIIGVIVGVIVAIYNAFFKKNV